MMDNSCRQIVFKKTKQKKQLQEIIQMSKMEN